MSSGSRSEGAIIQERLLHYDALGWRLFKNTSGVLKRPDGVPVRFGLGNVSAAVNEQYKTPDYVGWRPRLITPDMVGDVIAQMVGREFKHAGWVPAPPSDRARYAHEQAQLRWGNLLRADGGDWEFDSGVE